MIGYVNEDQYLECGDCGGMIHQGTLCAFVGEKNEPWHISCAEAVGIQFDKCARCGEYEEACECLTYDGEDLQIGDDEE